jgi:hypothetical protein
MYQNDFEAVLRELVERHGVRSLQITDQCAPRISVYRFPVAGEEMRIRTRKDGAAITKVKVWPGTNARPIAVSFIARLLSIEAELPATIADFALSSQ